MSTTKRETKSKGFSIAHPKPEERKPLFENYDDFEESAYVVAVSTYISYALLIFLGHVTDFLGKIGLVKVVTPAELGNEGFVPLFSDFESFFTRNLYRRIRDCWNRPITNVPGGHVDLINRDVDEYNQEYTLKEGYRHCLNLGSYNYLGFAQNEGPCAVSSVDAVKRYGVTTASPAMEFGTQDIHVRCEEIVAKFVGKEACMIVGMGFATNSTIIPALVDKDCIILSDSLNHASLVLGARVSGAKIQVFKHNNMDNLEFLLRQTIAEGQPRTHKPYKKILIIVEGIYSMEGAMVKLPRLIELKKKYKAYLYLDEAHSIGAIGQSGRGVCEYFGVDTKDVDIMMGTFTKSFGAAGGYIAADKDVIDHCRTYAHSYIYAPSMSAPVCAQVITSLQIIAGEDGTNDGDKRLTQLSRNSRYFRKKCIEMGFIIYGSDDSPVVPLLIYYPAKIGAFSRMMLKFGIAVVVVGYPATDLLTARARFCLSSSHSRADLNKALAALDIVGDIINMKYSRQVHVTGKFIPEEEEL